MMSEDHQAYERGLADGLKIAEKAETRIKRIIAKLRRVGDQCEAGGHKSRARMFRALAKEFEGRRYQ
jgi:hypothetical protein